MDEIDRASKASTEQMHPFGFLGERDESQRSRQQSEEFSLEFGIKCELDDLVHQGQI